MAEPGLPPAQRAPALVFAGFLLLVAASAAVLFAEKLGTGPAAVRAFYLGSEARFTGPRSLAGLLETAVPHLLAIPLAIFAVSHVVAAAGVLGAARLRWLTRLSFALALLGVAAGFGIRWLAPWLAWAKVAAFLGLEALLLAWSALFATAAWPRPRPASAGRAGRQEPRRQRRRRLHAPPGVDEQRLGPGGGGEREPGRAPLDHHGLR